MTKQHPGVTTEQALFEAMRQSPEFFRDQLLVEVEENQSARLGSRMEAWQRDEFAAKDGALKFMAGHAVPKPDVRRFWDQRARGHSKTSDSAVYMTWLLIAAVKPLKCVNCAEDREQARLLPDAMKTLARLNPWLFRALEYQNNKIINRRSGAELFTMSSDDASSWGTTPQVTFMDEFTHWTSATFFNSVWSSFAKKSGMVIVACNAGAGRDWKWRMKEHAMTSPLWHHFAPDGCIAGWIGEDDLAEQKVTLPPSEFARVWMNRWQETGGEFVTLHEAEACREPGWGEQAKTKADGWAYVAAVDYAEKRDRTVGVVCHQEGKKILVDRMDVVCPRLSRKATRIEWVENWMRNVRRDFGGNHGKVYFVLDPYQLVGTIQKFEGEYAIERFEFASGIGNWRMGLLLRQLIIHQTIRWYEGCGKIVDADGRELGVHDGRDDLETELASLVVKAYANGKKWRFDHLEDGVHHDDRAYALGAACDFIVRNSGGYDAWRITPPTTSGEFQLALGAD